MAITLPVVITAKCEVCNREGMISCNQWEIGNTDLAIVASPADLARDGFKVKGTMLVCTTCEEPKP